MESQLEFLYKELSTSYKAVLAVLKSAKSVREASDIVLTKFERPSDQSEAVQIKRTLYGQNYLEKFTGGSVMAKNISTGFINDKINGIRVNSDIRCNSDNYEEMSNRSIAYVVMHYTGNTKDTARANANYFAGAGRNASAHFFVDNNEIYQSVAIKDKAWHCGTMVHITITNVVMLVALVLRCVAQRAIIEYLILQRRMQRIFVLTFAE